uniref:Protein kinase domain-containing protein n=1 Tax=Schistosoma mansoni TaxID=6183 RepID=A0A5K4FBD9_SCHMA
MHADIVKENDSEILAKVLGGSLSNSEIYQLLYSAVVDKDYSFLQCLLKHSRLDFHEPFEADGFRLPILHHAVRLGDFNAFKLLLEYGLNPLVCAGICQQNDTEFICEDIIQFAFRFTSNPNNQKSILLLFQTFLHKLITNLVEACRKGDDESIEQLLTSSSSGSLRIRCTVKSFASRQFHLVVNSSNSSHDSSTDHVNDSIKPIHQPLTSLISNRLKSFKFNRRLSWITGSSRDNKKMEKKEKEEGQQQQDRPQTMLESLSSKEILRWSSDGIFESYNLQSMNNDLWEWARSQVKPLLVICVQNNYIQCLNKLLQVGFEVIPVNSSLSTTFSATEESVELLNHKQEINHDSKFNNGLRILVEDISSIGKQQLWIESVCSNQESAIHTAVRLNREEAVKSIIQWEPYSLAVTCHSNNDISIGILPIHIACALNRLNCLQLILTMNTSTLYLNNDYYNIENSESKLDSNHCNLFSCRINKSPGLYKHYYCIDQLDSYNMTGFLLAVIHGHVDIVRQLLKYTVKAKKIMNSTTTELNNFNIDINLDHLYQHHSTVPDNNTSTTNTTDTDKCTCSNELDVLGNQHSSLTDPCIDHTVYYDVCPIDIYRKISACWYFVTSIDNNNNNSVSLDYNRRPTIIINPRCHQSLDDHAICGYFNALQLSVMTGNIDTVSILVDYLSREVNTFCTSCMHGQCYVLQDHSTLSMVSLSNSTCYSSHLIDEIVSSNLNSTNLQSIITTPLGLTCCLAETDENKAIEIASVLLNIGAVDLNNQLFIYTMKKAFYKFAGLLFIHEILLKSTEINKPTENDPAVIIRHLNLSNMKSLQCSIISNSFWYLSSIIPQWIKLLEDLSKFNYVSSLKSSSSSMSTSVKQESTMNENNDNREFYKYISQLFLSLPRPTFTMNFFNNISNQLITRITMSNCGLKTLPWCLFNCVKNLKELDLSKNHIRNLPTQLPNVPMAYRSCQSVSTCWTSSLIYLDLSENCLDYLPSWLFVNMYEYEKGIISSSCKGKLNNNIIDSHPLRRCYSETSINTTTSSLHHTTVMNDSFAPNLLHLLLSKNQLRVLPSEIWTGSLWCKLESLDLSWNKIAYLPMPNLLKVQFEHSRQMYKQSLYMKTQCLRATDKVNYCTPFPNSTEGVTFNFNSESVSYLPTDQLITTITNHYQPVENYITANINNYNDNLFERKPVDCLYQYEQHTSHLTHLWLHHNCLKTLQLTNSISSINNYSTRIHSSKLLLSLAQICPNLLYLDASYNTIENFFDLFLCPESIIYIDLSYNHMKIPDEHRHHHDYDSQSSSPSIFCQFESLSKTFSMNRCLSEKNRSNSTSYSLRNWNLITFSTYNYYSKLEHLNLRGNQFHIFPYCCYTNTLMDKLNQTKIFHEFQLIKSLSFGIQPSCKVNLGSSYFMSTEKEIVLLFPKLKSLDLGENPYLKCIYPSLLHSMNLQYLSLDCCITLCELPGDLFRLPNLQSILLNKTPFIKHLATLIDPTLKVNQVAGIQGNNNDNDVNDYPNLNEKIYTRRILSCLKSVTDQSYPYTRFRVMVVGPTGVGKTTLVRLLQASETGKSSCQTNFNLNPFETDVHTSSSSSLRSNETDNIPDHLLPSVQITNLTISRHNNSKPNESINANVSSGITDNHRNFCETLSFSIWDLEKSVNTTISSVNTTTNNNDNFGSSISDMSSELVFPSEVIINTQLGIHCQLTIYLVLWNTSDGVLGLNRITPWLMKIKSINPNCPIILIGTYLLNISSINRKSKNFKNHFNLMKNVIYNRFYKNSDLNAYGLPYIYNYMFINLSNINDNKIEKIQKKISKLITLLYNAAYHFNITNRTADILFPNISIIPSLSQSFLQLSIPKLYHLTHSITQQLTIEIFNNQLLPIMEVNRFIFELNKCLSNLLPHPIRVCFSSNNNNNNGSAPVELLSTSSLPSSSSPSSASSSSLYVTSCIHGFYTYSDIKSILLFLNHIGTILYFSHHKLLKNYVFLSPQWLLNTLLKLMMNIHNKQLCDVFKNCHTLKRTEWMNTNTIQQYYDELMKSTQDISQLQDQVNDDDDHDHDKDSNHSKHIPNIVDNNNSFYLKRNSAVIDSSYLTDLIKYFMGTRKTVNDNTSHIHMNNLHDIPLEEIFLGLFKQFGLMVSIITNDDLKRQKSDSSKMRKHKKQLLLLPSLLAARCFQPGRLHSYLQPAVIRYEENYPFVKQGSCLRSQSLGVSTYRPRYTVHRKQPKLRPVNNMNTVESCNNNTNNNGKTNHLKLSRFLSWHVQTSVSKEIVRLYAVTYIPFGFWTELNTRLLNDISLHEICGRIYNLSKLPSELFQQLLCNKLQHNDNFKNCCQYNCSTDSRNDHGNIDNCHTFMNTSLKPEWTVWKRGMRLSLGHGQIGLARLQQLTRANCALLRSQSFKQSFLNVANNRQSPSLRAFVSSCSPRSSSFSSTRKTNELIAKLLPQSYYHEEWDEPCAIVGEEVMKQNKKSINNQNISNIEKDFISFNLQLNNDFVYRSGVVETIKHSYEGRCLRLMHWVVQDDQKNEGFQSFSTTMKPITTELSSLATTACQEQTVKTASDFKIHCNHGYLTDQEHDALQNSCLIEIYLPNLNIYWEYKQTDKYPTVNSNQAQNQLEVINSLRNHSQLRQNNLSPDPQAIAELLTKLVSHIDILLEDWYPDLGVKLNQSNEGIYLVERIIPCCACLATPNRYLNNFSRQSLSFSTDNHLQNMMKNSSFSSVNNQFKEMDKSCYGNKYCLNQFSLHNKKLSKSVQFLNHTDKQLKSSYLNSSILSITNDLFTSDSNNNNNTITEKYLAHRNMSSSLKWSWPFKWNRYKRAHSADPLKFTDDSKNENGNQNKLTDPSTAYMSFVYGITVSEYIHWYVMKKSNKLSQPGGLYCPIHSSIQLWAPDLQFKDIPSTLFISTDRVHLLEFLGRGAFGSIFKGSINNSLATKQQQQIGRLSNRIPFKTTNQFNNNRATDFIREVAVKLCSPIHPNLNSSSSYCIPMFNSVNCERINLSSSKEKCSTSNLSDALFLYRQEQRRWLHNPIEACLNAYQEIRAELNILLPITRNSLYSDQYSFSSSTSSSLLYHKSKRTNRLCNSYSFHEKRSNQSCFNKCLQKNQSKDSNSNVKTNNMSNNNLLICYGIIYPNPIGFLMPLIPLGNLSDYFTSLLTSYQDLLKTTVNTLEISSATTNCMNELFINHPLHPITMMLIINQVAKGLAYLHSLSIVHRDVKSENILIWSIPLPSTMMMMASSTLGLNDQNPSKVHIVLTDYGVSRFMSVRDDDEGDNGCRGYVGTPGYMAPEILDYIGEQTYTSKVDIYAMGILLCEMIQLEQPYKKLSSSFYRLAQQVISGVRPDIPQHFIKRCPITLINLMTYCWASDSNRRPSAEQIVHLTNSYQLSTSLSNESITNDCNDDNKKKEKKSNSLSIHYQNNCFSHIQSVHSIDFLKVVTCAIIDNNYNLWLGGYNPIHESFTLKNNDAQSIKLGLLIIIPLDNFSTKSSLLLASWPKIHVLKQYFKSFITQYNLYIKLSDWPIHLCLLNMNVDEEIEKGYKDSDISPQFITCLTYFGELRIYGLNNQHSLKYICLLKIHSSQYCSTLNGIPTSTTNDNNNLFQGINTMLSCIMYDYNQHVMNDQDHNSSLSPSPSSSSAAAATTLSNRCIHFILCLSFPQICIIKVNIHSSLMLRFDQLIFIDIDQPVHSGIILPEICGSNVWLSQTGGKLVCYAWDDSECEIHSSSSSSLPSSYLKFHSSWFVPSLFNSESSLVTHFLIGNSKLVSNRPEPLAEDIDASKHVCVWTYLEPDGKLDCWSAFSQTLLRSINLIQQLDNDMFSENLSTFEIVGSVNAMEWLNSSSSILLLTTHGYLIHINLMNTNVCGNSTTVSLSNTPMTTTNDTTVLRATSTTTTTAQTSSSSISPSSQSFCQLFHYHGSFSNKDFSLITPLTLSISQRKMTNFPKRIITISKGYLDPLNWINHNFSSASSSCSFTDSASFQSDFIKLTMSTNKNHSNMIECLNQEKFYLVKLFSDQFLFP